MRISDKAIDRIYINSAIRGSEFQMMTDHSHNYYELYYLRHGKVRLCVDNQFFTLQSGDFMVIPAGSNHFANYLAQCTRINIYFNKEELYDAGKPFMDFLEEVFLTPILMQVPKIYRDSINGIIDSMIAEENANDSLTSSIMKLLLRQLLLFCNRYCIFRTESDAEKKVDKILETVRYINENYNQPLTLSALAEYAGFSPSYFSKKFRQTTGTGMKEYLTDVRLAHAVNELLSTSHSITEIAMNSGFGDSNHFKDIFKKVYNMPPREYRKTVLEKYILNEFNKT